MACRFFLGISEAGFGPGIPYLLSFFYLRHEVSNFSKPSFAYRTLILVVRDNLESRLILITGLLFNPDLEMELKFTDRRTCRSVFESPSFCLPLL